MLTIRGNAERGFCDRVTRRQFLQIGGLAVGGLTLLDALKIEAQTGVKNRHKSIIMIYLPGGHAHQDTFDLKPDAPAEIRGEFKPIKTNVSGIEICEHLPRMAKQMDKFAVIRSLVGARDEHASNLCFSGYTLAESTQLNPPDIGSVMSKVQGQTDKSTPAFVNLAARTQHQPYNDPGAGYLGIAHNAFNPNGPMLNDMTLKGITLDRLSDRRRLLTAMDRFRGKVDSMRGMDEMSGRAFDMLTSSKLLNALNLDKEDPKVRERYGKGIAQPQGDASPMLNEQFLAARRLVEAGVRFVTVSYGFWDWHGSNFVKLKEHLPIFDQAITALVTDLHERGLDKDVSVIVWGDFGRTPRINKDGGRDHWPRVASALLAGGGMKTGQVIGSTNKFAEEADERPINYKQVVATLYHNVGIDISDTPIHDITGRPNFLLPGHELIPELV